MCAAWVLTIVLLQLAVERIVAGVHSRPSSGRKQPELGVVKLEIILELILAVGAEVLTKQQATISQYFFHELIPCLIFRPLKKRIGISSEDSPVSVETVATYSLAHSFTHAHT